MDMNFEEGFVVLARLTGAQSVGEVKSMKGEGGSWINNIEEKLVEETEIAEQ